MSDDDKHSHSDLESHDKVNSKSKSKMSRKFDEDTSISVKNKT